MSFTVVRDLTRECMWEIGEAPCAAAAVRYVEAEAGTGYRYAVAVTPLPRGNSEGGPLLVSLLSPWRASWTMQSHGHLSAGYVMEHFRGRSEWDAADLRAVLHLIRYALNREET